MAPANDDGPLAGVGLGLPADLLERLEAIGLEARQVYRHGAERVRWALDGCDAEHARAPVALRDRWVLNALYEHWGEPPSVLQPALPFAAAAADALRPPADSRWGLHRPSGQWRAVALVDADSVKWADGSRFPAHYWSADWAWYAERPGDDDPG